MTNAEARFNKIHIRQVYACLAVTCHLHFWQNDRDFLRATVVTRGWNGYRNKSHHRKSTLEMKILPPFQQGFEPATFQSRVRCSNHWAIPPHPPPPPPPCSGHGRSFLIAVCRWCGAGVLNTRGLQNQLNNLKAKPDRLNKTGSKPCKNQHHSV